MMNDDKFGMKNLDGISPVVIAVLGKDCDIGFQSFEIFLNKVTRALVEEPVLSKGKEIKITSTFNEGVSYGRSGPRP